MLATSYIHASLLFHRVNKKLMKKPINTIQEMLVVGLLGMDIVVQKNRLKNLEREEETPTNLLHMISISLWEIRVLYILPFLLVYSPYL